MARVRSMNSSVDSNRNEAGTTISCTYFTSVRIEMFIIFKPNAYNKD